MGAATDLAAPRFETHRSAIVRVESPVFASRCDAPQHEADRGPCRGSPMTRLRLDPYLPIIGVIGLIAIWYVAVWYQVVDKVLLPSPTDTFRALWSGMTGGRLGFDFWRTVERTTIATLIAAAIAIPLGIFLGASEKIYRSVEFVVDFFRSTPASAMFPLFLVLFGVGDKTKISVAAFGAALVILFNVAYGVMNARKTRLLAAKVMGASRLRVLTDVMLLESLPQTFVGLRNGVSLALVIVVVAEMFIGSTDGLGHRVFEAQQLFAMPDMYAAIFAAGALGYGLNLLFLLVERRFVHWSGK
jgi:ABC-type nitrate/sulfonate/bicarbonate transport system permease component